MGGGPAAQRRKISKLRQRPAPKPPALHTHPRLELPEKPPASEPDALIRWTSECMALLVSPPQVDGEDNEYSCTDVAGQVRDFADVLVTIPEGERWQP